MCYLRYLWLLVYSGSLEIVVGSQTLFIIRYMCCQKFEKIRLL